MIVNNVRDINIIPNANVLQIIKFIVARIE